MNKAEYGVLNYKCDNLNKGLDLIIGDLRVVSDRLEKLEELYKDD